MEATSHRTVYRTLDGNLLDWDTIRETPVTIDLESRAWDGAGPKIHESLLRSWRILDEVKAMLDRGDSAFTVRKFIEWAEAREAQF